IRALKARIAPAEIAFWIFIRALHCAGKESPAQRAERNEADAEMTQQRDDARLEVALPQRILALQCRYRVHGMSAPYGLLTRFRKSEKANLAGVHEISHRADDVLDRDRRIDAVLVQQVYMICLQTTERALHGFANVQRPAVQATLLARFPDAPPELGRDRRLIPLSLERAAEQFLVGERPVHLGGIQKRDADLERPVQCRDRLAFVTLFRRSIRCGHPHASEPDGGDGEALGAELSLRDHACGSSFVYDDDVSSIRNKDAWSRGWKWRAPAWRRAYTTSRAEVTLLRPSRDSSSGLAWAGGRPLPCRCLRHRRRTCLRHRTRVPKCPLRTACRVARAPLLCRHRRASDRCPRLPTWHARVRRPPR